MWGQKLIKYLKKGVYFRPVLLFFLMVLHYYFFFYRYLVWIALCQLSFFIVLYSNYDSNIRFSLFLLLLLLRSVHYLLGLWERLVSGIPYLKSDKEHFLTEYTPQVFTAYWKVGIIIIVKCQIHFFTTSASFCNLWK